MAVTNLRNAEMMLKDGASPSALSLDEGDLSWTEQVNTVEVKNCGSIASGHLR